MKKRKYTQLDREGQYVAEIQKPTTLILKLRSGGHSIKSPFSATPPNGTMSNKEGDSNGRQDLVNATKCGYR